MKNCIEIYKGIKFLSLILLIFFFVKPAFSSEKILIASFSTSVADQTAAVKINIGLACKKLNGSIILAKEIFSFNEIVGEGSAKNGFVNGLVLYRGETKMEPGGGLCQVSSTLFNVMLLAGMRIAERHRHYQPVTYVPPGLDATIKYGKKNLRMKNPYKQKLVILTELNEKSLNVKIYGEKKIHYHYLLETEEEEINLPLADSKDDLRQGMAIYVFRKKYKGGKLIEKFLLYKDFYPPVYIK